MLLFVYGSLMKGFWNDCFLENAKYIGPCITNNKYVLTMEDKIPYISQKKQLYRVVGELYDVNDTDIQDIDYHEGNGSWYFRELISVKNDSNEDIQAWCYISDIGEGIEYHNGDFKDYIRYTYPHLTVSNT